MSQNAATSSQPAIPLITRSVAPTSNARTDATPINGTQAPPVQNASSATPNSGPHHPAPSSHANANGTANYEGSAFVKRDPPVPSPQFPTEVE